MKIEQINSDMRININGPIIPWFVPKTYLPDYLRNHLKCDEELNDRIVHSVFDGMTYDISNPSLHNYREMEQFCQNKSGSLATVDSESKLGVLKSLMKRYDNGKNGQKYLIG